MSRIHLWVINLLFAVCAVVFGFRTWNIWFSDASAVTPPVSSSGYKTSYLGLPDRPAVSASEYDAIVNRNLFSVDRKSVKPADAPDSQQNAQVGKKIRLYGILITTSAKAAIIDMSDQPDKRQAVRVKEGDLVQGVKIISILPDRILVSEGEHQKEIPLYAENKSIQRITVEKSDKATLVTKDGVMQPPAPNPNESTEKKPEGTDQSVKPPEEEYEIFNTPFGPIKRRKK